MSDTTPETPTDPTPAERTGAEATPAEPVSAGAPVEGAVAPQDAAVVPAGPVSSESADVAEPIELVEPVAESPIADTAVVAETPRDEKPVEVPEPQSTTAAAPQTVYVHAPVPPKKKGNRGLGSLIALGSAIIFAAIYAGVVLAVVPWFAPPHAVGFEFSNFISSTTFFVPVLVFAVGFILLVLILNRAGWWSYILGSLFVGVFVYFVSIGVLLLVNGVIGFTPSEALKAFLSALQSPVTVIAGLVGREVALWMGAAIAALGRRVKVRNAETQAAYDRDTARARADYERAVAANAAD